MHDPFSFQTIETRELATVAGGDGENSTGVTVTGEIKLPTGAGGSATIDATNKKTDYGYCVDSVRSMGGTFDDVLRVCGQP